MKRYRVQTPKIKDSKISMKFSKSSLKAINLLPKDRKVQPRFRYMKKPKYQSGTIFEHREKSLRNSQLVKRKKPFQFLKRSLRLPSNKTRKSKLKDAYRIKMLTNFYKLKKQKMNHYVEPKARTSRSVLVPSPKKQKNGFVKNPLRRNQSCTTKDFLQVKKNSKGEDGSSNAGASKANGKKNPGPQLGPNLAGKIRELAGMISKVLTKVYRRHLNRSKAEFVKLFSHCFENDDIFLEKGVKRDEAKILKNLIFKNNAFLKPKIWFNNFSSYSRSKSQYFDQEETLSRA